MGIVRWVGRGALRLSTEAVKREGRTAAPAARVGADGPGGGRVRAVEDAPPDDAGQIAPEQTPVCEATQPPERGQRS